MFSRVMVCVLGVGLLLLPAVGSAQQTGSIAGIVRDVTGGVLPGVTVEASSPALIERVRSVTTDQTGQYKLADLRPGTYMVSFTMQGFGAVRREGIELSAGFTATVNTELKVGDMAETITVSGQSPIVDVQNVTQSRVMTRDVLDSIPSGKQFTALASLVPGVTITGSNGALTQDVGGSSGMAFAMATIHGGKQDDQTVHINGMSVASLTSIGNSRTNIQDGNVEEYSMQLASQAAEFAYGGIYVNVIPKEGGNTFRGALFASGTNTGLQSNNLDSDLVQRGLRFPNQVKSLYDINPSFGGPLRNNKLWFYTAARFVNTQSYIGGLFYNADPTSWVYTPDTSRKAVNDQSGKNESLNLTWQALEKHKFTLFYNNELQCYCHFGISPNLSPEASLYMQSNNRLVQGTWASPITNKLLVDAGFSYYWNDLPRDRQPGSTEPGITNLSTGLTYRGGGQVRNPQTIDYMRAALSYVTGTHALKVGFVYMYAHGRDWTFRTNGNLTYSVLNAAGGGVTPQSVTFYTTPYSNTYNMRPGSVFAQDQWKVGPLTVNVGGRLDLFRSAYGDSRVPATEYLPFERVYAGAEVLHWTDFSPRLGVAWDLFGNGKTAIKASMNRYVLQEAKGNTTALDPVLAATNSISRTWNDANRDFTLQGDPLNPAANGELGPSPNSNFGKPTSTLRFDPAWASGFGVRPYQWEGTVSIQHELVPRLSVNFAYFRRIYGNFIATYNELVTAADYSPYCITAPVDARLPGGGGNPICGLFDLNPSKLGQVSNVRTLASTFGEQTEHWNGVDLTLNARLQRGILLQGGLSTGKHMADNCAIWSQHPNVGDAVFTSATSPSLPTSTGTSSASGAPAQFCHQVTPSITQVKFLGSYEVPRAKVQVSGAFQSIVPDPTQGQAFTPMGLPANYVATNAVIAPSLGRNLSAGANGTVTINIAEPGKIYAPRANQLDLRLARTFTIGRTRIQPLVDFFNVLNANPVFQFNSAYGTNGASWKVPQSLMPGRLIRLGGQINF